MMIDARITDAFWRDTRFPASSLLVLGQVGSHSHGTYLPPSDPTAVDDVDYMGVFVPPLDYHLGLPRQEHWTYKHDELDVVCYTLDKTVRLLLKGNPNIVGLLWLRAEDYVHRTPLFDVLCAHRDIFSSQAVGEAFSGYAYGQLKRMEAFDLDRIAEYEALVATLEPSGPLAPLIEGDANVVAHTIRTRALPEADALRYRALHRKYFSGYMGNKRKAVVRQFGYDVKNAAHLVRLLRMGTEFLRSGVLQVYRTEDAEELKSIKRGEWTLTQVHTEAERAMRLFEAARTTTALPPHPDSGAANDLLVDLHLHYFGLIASAR